MALAIELAWHTRSKYKGHVRGIMFAIIALQVCASTTFDAAGRCSLLMAQWWYIGINEVSNASPLPTPCRCPINFFLACECAHYVGLSKLPPSEGGP